MVGSAGVMLLAIDGPAGSGKTTLASKLEKELLPSTTVTVIHMDDLYNGWKDALSAELGVKLLDIVQAHLGGKGFYITKFNWATMEFGAPELVSASQVLILEGVGAAQKVVRDAGAKTYWIEAAPEIGLQRVLDRDGHHLREQMLTCQINQDAHFNLDETAKNCEIKLTS